MNETIFKATRDVINRAMVLSIMAYEAAKENMGGVFSKPHLLRDFGTCKLGLSQRIGKTTWVTTLLPDPEFTVVVAEQDNLNYIQSEVAHARVRPALAYAGSIGELKRLSVDARYNDLVKHIVVDEYTVFDNGRGLSTEFYSVVEKFPNLQCIVALSN